MKENECELTQTLTKFEKGCYKLFKVLDIDVQINPEGINDRFNIPEADMPKINAICEFVSFVTKNKKDKF